MARHLDDTDARLLNRLQEQIPLLPSPFAAIGQELGLGEAEVLQRLSALKSGPKPVIRQISAIFDTKALGYRSCLVAAKVEPARLEAAAHILNQHPGVTHNYERNHAYNLWYTVAVPSHSRLGLEKTVDLLHRLSGAQATRMFPTLKLFKIGVSFDLTGGEAPVRQAGPRFTEEHRKQAMGFEVTEADRRMIRVLQQDLPIVARPFDAWAQEAGVSTEQLLAAARKYQEQKQMRRFSAVLHHRQAGFSANAMGVWAVPPERQEAFGATAATFQAVSHCYLRPTYEDWPYSIFTMVHGAQVQDCTAVLEAIAQATGVGEYQALYSSREFKKIRLRYFTGEIEAWEEERIAEK